MTGYADIADLPEDRRIEIIGHQAMFHKKVVAFFVDDDTVEAGKADRYIDKLKRAFPGIQVMHRGPGPVAGTTLVKVGPPAIATGGTQGGTA